MDPAGLNLFLFKFITRSENNICGNIKNNILRLNCRTSIVVREYYSLDPRQGFKTGVEYITGSFYSTSNLLLFKDWIQMKVMKWMVGHLRSMCIVFWRQEFVNKKAVARNK